MRIKYLTMSSSNFYNFVIETAYEKSLKNSDNQEENNNDQGLQVKVKSFYEFINNNKNLVKAIPIVDNKQIAKNSNNNLIQVNNRNFYEFIELIKYLNYEKNENSIDD